MERILENCADFENSKAMLKREGPTVLILLYVPCMVSVNNYFNFKRALFQYCLKIPV